MALASETNLNGFDNNKTSIMNFNSKIPFTSTNNLTNSKLYVSNNSTNKDASITLPKSGTSNLSNNISNQNINNSTNKDASIKLPKFTFDK